MADEPRLASLSLTHVNYDASDPLSHISAFLALVPQALMVSYITLLWATREVEVLLMFAGQMGCEAVNFMLKRYIKEERPRLMHGKGYGMPSSHAQFMTYFGVYMSLFLLARHIPHAAAGTPMRVSERAFVSLAALLAAAAVAASRIYLRYHTTKQVWVGITAGASLALLWFLVTVYLRRSGWVEWAIESRIGRALRMRDLVVDEDLPDAGWMRWQERKRKRNLKSL